MADEHLQTEPSKARMQPVLVVIVHAGRHRRHRARQRRRMPWQPLHSCADATLSQASQTASDTRDRDQTRLTTAVLVSSWTKRHRSAVDSARGTKQVLEMFALCTEGPTTVDTRRQGRNGGRDKCMPRNSRRSRIVCGRKSQTAMSISVDSIPGPSR